MSSTNFPLKNHFDLSPLLLPWIILTSLWIISFTDRISRTGYRGQIQARQGLSGHFFDSFLKTLSAYKTIFVEKFIITLWNIQIWLGRIPWNFEIFIFERKNHKNDNQDKFRNSVKKSYFRQKKNSKLFIGRICENPRIYPCLIFVIFPQKMTI